MLFGYTLFSALAQPTYYGIAIICGCGFIQQFLTYWQVRRSPSLPFHMVLSFALAVSFLFAGEAERTSSLSNAVTLRFASVLALDVALVAGLLMLIILLVETLEISKTRSKK